LSHIEKEGAKRRGTLATRLYSANQACHKTVQCQSGKTSIDLILDQSYL